MAPLTYFNDGGTGVRVIFFLGSEILAQRDCLGSMKDAGIFLGRERKTEGFGGGGGGGCEKRTKVFFGYAKKQQ